MVEQAVLEALASADKRRVEQAAAGATLLAQRSPRGVHLVRLATKLLNTLEERCQNYGGGADDDLDAIVRALRACLARGPRSVASVLVTRIKTWDWWTVAYPSQAFNCELPRRSRESWLPLVIKLIADRNVEVVARKEVADAVSRSASEGPPGLGQFFAQCVALLVRLTDELEGVVARQEDDALISFIASRIETTAISAGYSAQDSISSLWNTASGEPLSEAAAAKLLALTGRLAGGDRRRSAQVVPLGAAQILPGRPLRLVLGGVRLLGAVGEQSPELLPPNVLKALTDCLRWSGNEYVQAAVFELFQKAQIAERPIAVELFEAMKETLDVWLEAGCQPESTRALLRCAREQARGSSSFTSRLGDSCKGRPAVRSVR